MAQTVDFDLSLYADESCLVYTAIDVKKIETNINTNFNSMCEAKQKQLFVSGPRPSEIFWNSHLVGMCNAIPRTNGEGCKS